MSCVEREQKQQETRGTVVTSRWNNIVMSTSVCVCRCGCVCLSARISPEPHTRSLPNFCECCPWPWLGPSQAGWQNPKENGQFSWFSFPLTLTLCGKHELDKPDTPNNGELNWSMQWHTTGADAWLQALNESIIGREVGSGIAHWGRSLISTIALLFLRECRDDNCS